jgi:hypothetical protein
MLKSTEVIRILNRCIKNSQVFYKEEGVLFPMLIVLRKGEEFNINIINKSITYIKNSKDESDTNTVDPPEYYTESGEKISVSFVVFKRGSVKDDNNLALVAKQIVKDYDPDAIGLITAVSSKEPTGDIKSINILYTAAFIKNQEIVLRSFIPFTNEGELPEDKKETILIEGDMKTINYGMTFIDTAWTSERLYTHFLTNPYVA